MLEHLRDVCTFFAVAGAIFMFVVFVVSWLKDVFDWIRRLYWILFGDLTPGCRKMHAGDGSSRFFWEVLPVLGKRT
jgi:hypothetical protein